MRIVRSEIAFSLLHISERAEQFDYCIIGTNRTRVHRDTDRKVFVDEEMKWGREELKVDNRKKIYARNKNEQDKPNKMKR